jgi:DNA-binding HxlR family transcriptional regulator
MGAKGGTKLSNGDLEVTGVRHVPDCAMDRSEGNFGEACTVRKILDRIGDKWSVLVVLRLGAGPERFRALLRAVEGISARMLTVTVRGLERDGLVKREVFDTRPPSVEYSLTPLGYSLLDRISTLANWAVENEIHIKKAQRSFDSRSG